MAIVRYPNRVPGRQAPAIDHVMAKSNPIRVAGHQDLASAGMDDVIFAGTDGTVYYSGDWRVNSISLQFSNAAARTYSVNVIEGRLVAAELNDALWFHVQGTSPQRITLNPGFYNGTELAIELESELDANVAYTAAGITFTVSYTAATGLFEVTPSSSTIRYLNTNTQQTLRTTDSIGGHLFGFRTTTAFGSSVTSDTPVYSLNQEVAIISEVGSTELNRYHDTIHILCEDQALSITGTTGPSVEMSYSIVYDRSI